jgi:hypothetical protein
MNKLKINSGCKKFSEFQLLKKSQIFLTIIKTIVNILLNLK